jgi:hypothetical protein
VFAHLSDNYLKLGYTVGKTTPVTHFPPRKLVPTNKLRRRHAPPLDNMLVSLLPIPQSNFLSSPFSDKTSALT